jgi:hypothetical protein
MAVKEALEMDEQNLILGVTVAECANMCPGTGSGKRLRF